MTTKLALYLFASLVISLLKRMGLVKIARKDTRQRRLTEGVASLLKKQHAAIIRCIKVKVINVKTALKKEVSLTYRR